MLLPPAIAIGEEHLKTFESGRFPFESKNRNENTPSPKSGNSNPFKLESMKEVGNTSAVETVAAEKKARLVIVGERTEPEDPPYKPFRIYMRWEPTTGTYKVDWTNGQGEFASNPNEALRDGTVLRGHWLGLDRNDKYKLKSSSAKVYFWWEKEDATKQVQIYTETCTEPKRYRAFGDPEGSFE
jgi:hypothetical protein